jgi:hypothetical protein
MPSLQRFTERDEGRKDGLSVLHDAKNERGDELCGMSLPTRPPQRLSSRQNADVQSTPVMGVAGSRYG